MHVDPGQLQELRRVAQKRLPAAPIVVQESAGIDMSSYEVAVAVNLDLPYRHAQDIVWLQVMAANPRAASAAATDWVLKAPREFESTGLVRVGSTHRNALGFGPGRQALEIFWSAPVLHDAPPATVVRHPVTGLRLGFVAHPSARRRWLPAEAAGFCLLSRKPTPSSDPAGLAPIVWHARGPQPALSA